MLEGLLGLTSQRGAGLRQLGGEGPRGLAGPELERLKRVLEG